MILLLLSFLAGILTVLAPCVLPLLPIIIGGSLDTANKLKPYFIVLGLVISITLFTILLKASTLFINVDPQFWNYVSGGILILFGLVYIFPSVWDKISLKLGLSSSSDKLLHKASLRTDFLGNMLLGAALGPVFASCSPTYSLIIATVLPVNFWQGVVYILVYALGLALVMLAVALLGRKLVKNLNVFSNPNSWFKKSLGVLFIVLGIIIVIGFDKTLETNILNAGFFDETKTEQQLLQTNLTNTANTGTDSSALFNQPGTQQAPEITGITNWINSNGETLANLKGKVVLVDFWTYSCINCERTLPFITKWYDTYKDQGFVVLGIHAPEFSFEQKLENVQMAVKQYNINYPVGLDNNYATWNAYKNQYWPAEYLIDKNGFIRRTNFGEGDYDQTEQAIRALLQENGASLSSPIVAGTLTDNTPKTNFCDADGCVDETNETYLGSDRGDALVNAAQATALNTPLDFSLTDPLTDGSWGLDGKWTIENQDIISDSDSSKLSLKFDANHVYLVMGSDTPAKISVLVDGKLQNLGEDVDSSGNVTVSDYKLYKIVKSDNFLKGSTVQLTVPKGVKLNVFTFG
jgi:cytochrome c biogenesis protein CcdA/thiol-disulfide isomerase/thioredoxin